MKESAVELQAHCFEYSYEGSDYIFQIQATSAADAVHRLARLADSVYLGVLSDQFPTKEKRARKTPAQRAIDSVKRVIRRVAVAKAL